MQRAIRQVCGESVVMGVCVILVSSTEYIFELNKNDWMCCIIGIFVFIVSCLVITSAPLA